MHEPTLRTKVYFEDGIKYRLTVMGGLHMLEGNKKPYFSLTGDQMRQAKNNRWVWDMGGCLHDEILKFYPELKDLADLHLSDIDGIPMHSVENGWYWLKGGCYVFGEWKDAETNGGKSTLQVLAEHLRISESEAFKLRVANFSKADFTAYVEAQKPRWKAEAKATIEKHGLVVFGNKYEEIA